MERLAEFVCQSFESRKAVSLVNMVYNWPHHNSDNYHQLQTSDNLNNSNNHDRSSHCNFSNKHSQKCDDDLRKDISDESGCIDCLKEKTENFPNISHDMQKKTNDKSEEEEEEVDVVSDNEAENTPSNIVKKIDHDVKTRVIKPTAYSNSYQNEEGYCRDNKKNLLYNIKNEDNSEVWSKNSYVSMQTEVNNKDSYERFYSGHSQNSSPLAMHSGNDCKGKCSLLKQHNNKGFGSKESLEDIKSRSFNVANLIAC